MLIFRLHLPKGKRHAFDSAWKEYCHYDLEGGPNYPFLEQYAENTWDGQPTKDLALQRINKLLEFSEDAPLLPFKLPFMG